MDTRQTKRIRRVVSDGSRQKRLAAARRHIEEIRQDLLRLAQVKTDVQRQFARWRERMTGEPVGIGELPVEDVTLQARARRLLFAATLVLVLEMGLAGFIAKSWLNFSTPVAAGVGAVLAAILAAIADVLIGLMEDPENPRTSEERIKIWTRWLTVSCLAVLTAICLTRFFAIGIVVFPWASGALTILLPATAGSYLTLRAVLAAGNRIAAVWTSLDDEERVTRILEGEVTTRLQELQGMPVADRALETSEEGTRSETRGPRAAIWPLLALLLPGLLAGLSAQPVWAEAWSVEVVQIRVDASGSLDSGESMKAVAHMRSTLTQLIRQPGSEVRRVDVYAWATAKDAASSPAFSFYVTPPPVVRCDPPKLSEAETILRMAAEGRKRQAERECAARRQKARAAYEQSLSSTLAKIDSSLNTILARQGASQTCFFQVLHEVADTPAGNLVLLLTDAEHSNCNMPPSPVARPRGPVYVVLVPGQSDGDDALQRRDARTRQIQGFLPAARIVPSNKVDGSLGWLAIQSR